MLGSPNWWSRVDICHFLLAQNLIFFLLQRNSCCMRLSRTQSFISLWNQPDLLFPCPRTQKGNGSTYWMYFPGTLNLVGVIQEHKTVKMFGAVQSAGGSSRLGFCSRGNVPSSNCAIEKCWHNGILARFLLLLNFRHSLFPAYFPRLFFHFSTTFENPSMLT